MFSIHHWIHHVALQHSVLKLTKIQDPVAKQVARVSRISHPQRAQPTTSTNKNLNSFNFQPNNHLSISSIKTYTTNPEEFFQPELENITPFGKEKEHPEPTPSNFGGSKCSFANWWKPSPNTNQPTPWKAWKVSHFRPRQVGST